MGPRRSATIAAASLSGNASKNSLEFRVINIGFKGPRVRGFKSYKLKSFDTLLCHSGSPIGSRTGLIRNPRFDKLTMTVWNNRIPAFAGMTSSMPKAIEVSRENGNPVFKGMTHET
jgi:hypothetical protein